MPSSRQPLPAHEAGRRPGPGAIVRGARMAQGLSLEQFGARVGYSASQLSRYERGIAPLTDITVLRRFADALGLPPEVFGLSPPGGMGATRHADFTQHRPRAARGNSVDHERQWEDGDDPVRRREMLASAAALAGAAALGQAGPRAGPGPVLLPPWRTSCTAGRTPRPSRWRGCAPPSPGRGRTSGLPATIGCPARSPGSSPQPRPPATTRASATTPKPASCLPRSTSSQPTSPSRSTTIRSPG